MLPTQAQILAAADLRPTLPPDIPVQIVRTWGLHGNNLVLRFTLKNKTEQPVQIGALGIPMIFNNVLNDRSLEQAHAICSFYDPYIGEDAGYLQVTRLSGHGPALLVLPLGKTPFEAYNPILDERRSAAAEIFRDPTPRGITFEGFYRMDGALRRLRGERMEKSDSVERSNAGDVGARRIEDSIGVEL